MLPTSPDDVAAPSGAPADADADSRDDLLARVLATLLAQQQGAVVIPAAVLDGVPSGVTLQFIPCSGSDGAPALLCEAVRPDAHGQPQRVTLTPLAPTIITSSRGACGPLRLSP